MPRNDDDFLKYAVGQLVDWIESELLTKTLMAWRDSLIRQQQIKLETGIQRMDSILSGDPPEVVQSRLSKIY